MIYPTCPECNVELDYEEQMNEPYYDGNTCNMQWRGICPNCNHIYTWWENYELTSIEGMEEVEE